MSHSFLTLTKGEGLLCRQLRVRPMDHNNNKTMKVNLYGFTKNAGQEHDRVLRGDPLLHPPTHFPFCNHPHDSDELVLRAGEKTYSLKLQKEDANPALKIQKSGNRRHENWSWSGPKFGVKSVRKQKRSASVTTRKMWISTTNNDQGEMRLYAPPQNCRCGSGRTAPLF